MRLIDADALVQMPWVLPNRMTRETALECFRNIVGEAPTIDAEPVRHGRWIKDDYYKCWYCSECRAVVRHNCSNYCNCGAKMDGGACGG